MEAGRTRKPLKRLPHVFEKSLELPCRSDADVAVEEGLGFLMFIASIDHSHAALPTGGTVRAHAVEIHPGVVRVVVRKHDPKINHGTVELVLDELRMDTWRCRLPVSARPEHATAEFVGGELKVLVPNGRGSGVNDLLRCASMPGKKRTVA